MSAQITSVFARLEIGARRDTLMTVTILFFLVATFTTAADVLRVTIILDNYRIYTANNSSISLHVH